MLMLRIAAMAMVCGVLHLTLRYQQPAIAFLLSIGTAAALLAGIVGQLQPALGFWQAMASYGQGQNMQCLLRVLGIALAAQFGADTCREAGMAAAAGAVELCGRALAMLQALPLLQGLLDSFLSFLQ